MTSDISTLLGNKVRPTFVDPDTGRTYRVSYLTQGKKAEFELWVKQHVLSVLKDLREVLTPEEWQSHVREYSADCVAGKYFFHGEACEKLRETIDGKLTLAAMLFECATEEMIDLGRRHPDNVRELINRVMEESGYGRPEANGEAGSTEASEEANPLKRAAS